MYSADIVAPDVPSLRERVVVAPCAGKFHPLPAETFTSEGEWVEVGQIVGAVESSGETVPVESRFRGWMMGSLALPGQPVRPGDALFWVWPC